MVATRWTLRRVFFAHFSMKTRPDKPFPNYEQSSAYLPHSTTLLRTRVQAGSHATIHVANINPVASLKTGRNHPPGGPKEPPFLITNNRPHTSAYPCIYEHFSPVDVMTHMDSDHIGGIKEILTAVRDRTTSLSVGTLVLPYVKERGETYREMQKLAKEAGVRVLTVQAGDSFIEGGEAESGKNSESKLNVRVLGPEPAVEVSPIDENAQCIVLSVSYGDFDALLTGDVSGAGEANLVKILRNQDKEYELLKVAHHGSKYSTPKELLDLIRPQMSVISVGQGNWYGHPHAELIKRLKASGTDIYETEYAGAVTVTSDGKGFRAEKFVNGQSIGTAVYNSAA